MGFIKKIFYVFVLFPILSYSNDLSIKYKEIILPNNFNNNGINILDHSFIKSLKNTIIVINEDFDLQGKTLILNDNICLKFNGGSIRNGLIKLQKSNEIFSTFEKQCFYDIKFSGTYSKVFPLSLIGIIADGKDKSDILSNLCNIIYTNKKSIYCVFTKLSINGNIICNKNEINIPANIDIYGNEGASISFTSAIGDYCISVSHNTGIHNISFNNTNIDYKGTILMGDCRLYDRNNNIYGGGAFLNINNVKISGKYSDNGKDFNCTGIRLVASNKTNKDFSYFTNIQSDILRISNTKIGVDILYENYEKEKFTWGNEININNLYINASKCGIRIRTKENAIKNKIQESGHSCFNIYKFQASSSEAVAFDIESVSHIIFLNFVSWDNTTWGIIKKNASVAVLYDMRPFHTLTSQNEKDYLAIREGEKKRYIIYKGLLERKFTQYKR